MNSKHFIWIPLAILVVGCGAFLIFHQDAVSEDTICCFYGVTYVNNQPTSGVDILLWIDDNSEQTESYTSGQGTDGQYNVGDYRWTGEFCLRARYPSFQDQQYGYDTSGVKLYEGCLLQHLKLTRNWTRCEETGPGGK